MVRWNIKYFQAAVKEWGYGFGRKGCRATPEHGKRHGPPCTCGRGTRRNAPPRTLPRNGPRSARIRMPRTRDAPGSRGRHNTPRFGRTTFLCTLAGVRAVFTSARTRAAFWSVSRPARWILYYVSITIIIITIIVIIMCKITICARASPPTSTAAARTSARGRPRYPPQCIGTGCVDARRRSSGLFSILVVILRGVSRNRWHNILLYIVVLRQE